MSLRVEKALVGADPELFLVDVNGKFISSVGLVGGSKSKPRPIGEGCAVQEDNVAVEYNIAPASTVEEFIKANTYALETIAKEVAERGLFLSVTASKVFDEDQLQTDAARVFGCEPDYNGWTGKENARPQGVDPRLRSCGGHVHIGSKLHKLQLVRWCDAIHGLHSVLEDDNTERRLLYGKAGSFRPKPYGVEYRTLSNYWLRNADMMAKVFDRTQLVVEKVNLGWFLEEREGDAIQKAINTSDRRLAEDLLTRYT